MSTNELTSGIPSMSFVLFLLSFSASGVDVVEARE
jgi:hypothetical protein